MDLFFVAGMDLFNLSANKKELVAAYILMLYPDLRASGGSGLSDKRTALDHFDRNWTKIFA